MRLKKIVILAIKGNVQLKRDLRVVLNVSNPTLWRYLEHNDDILTKAAALQLISRAVEIPIDELMEPSKPKTNDIQNSDDSNAESSQTVQPGIETAIPVK